jgi:hypothetical protein
MSYRALADLIVVGHFAFPLFSVFGGVWTQVEARCLDTRPIGFLGLSTG